MVSEVSPESGFLAGVNWRFIRKVAVMKSSGKFVVCDRGNERSRMQIFSKHGHFVRLETFPCSQTFSQQPFILQEDRHSLH